MAKPVQVAKFKINPVEIGVVMAISALTAWSAYDLLKQKGSFHAHSLAPMSSNPRSERGLSDRMPASVLQVMADLNVDCYAPAENPVSQDVSAKKIRLNGFFCGSQGGEKPVKATITNETTRYKAELFPDSLAPTFTTDYIPLSGGTNQVKVEFAYADGRSFFQQIDVTRL